MEHTGCGASSSMVIDHSEKIVRLEARYDQILSTIMEMKDTLEKTHKMLCISNGKQSVIDSLEETKTRILIMEKELVEYRDAIVNEKAKRDASKRWTIEKILVGIGIIANIVATLYRT